MVNNLNFDWGEVHDVAEQLEHIKSEELIESRSGLYRIRCIIDPKNPNTIINRDSKIKFLNMLL